MLYTGEKSQMEIESKTFVDSVRGLNVVQVTYTPSSILGPERYNITQFSYNRGAATYEELRAIAMAYEEAADWLYRHLD